MNTKSIHHASSSSTSLLPIEQVVQPPIHAYMNHEVSNLHCINHHSNLNSSSSLEEKHQMSLNTMPNEKIENNTNTSNSLRNSILESDRSINNLPQETSSHVMAWPNSHKKKRTHTSNPLYITKNLNKSLFNEGSTNKRARTPLSNSPSSPIYQSPVETRPQSPLPIPHELQTSLVNVSYTNQSEDIIDSYDTSSIFEIPLNFSNYDEDINDLMDISIDDYDTNDLSMQYTTTTYSTFSPPLHIEHVNESSSEDLSNESNMVNNSNEMDIEKIDEVQWTSFVELMNDASNEGYKDVEITQSYFEETNIIEGDSIDKLIDNIIEETNNEAPLNSLAEMMNDDIEHSTFEETNDDTKTFKKHQEKLSSLPKELVGVHLKKKNWVAILPRSLYKDGKYWALGQYATAEAAARVRDLVALKIKKYEDPKFELNFPISDYNDDLKEMENWNLRDYIWSLYRQSTAFKAGDTGFKCVYLIKNNKKPQMWEGKICNVGGKLKGYKNIVHVDKNLQKEIPAIFCDLVNLHLHGWEYMTNFRPGLYNKSDVKKFIALLEKQEQSKAYEWDLIKNILAEPLPFNSYIDNPLCTKRNESSNSRTKIVKESVPNISKTKIVEESVSNIKINKKNQQKSIIDMKNDARKKSVQKKLIGVSSVRSKYWKATMIIPNSKNKGRWTIGHYATMEEATRVRDLIALKLNYHKNNQNYYFYFPISDYNDDLQEMKNWSEKDYIWSLRRQSLTFSENESGLRCVRSFNNFIKTNKHTKIQWEGCVVNHGGKIKGFESFIIIGPYNTKEIPAIFCDLINLYIKGWDYLTNFRPGHYSQIYVENFISLLEKYKQDEACEWKLVKQILAESLPFIIHIQNSTSEKIVESNTPNFDDTEANNDNMNESLLDLVQGSAREKNNNLNLDNDNLIQYNIQPKENVLNISLKNLKQFENTNQNFGAKMQPRDIAKRFIECPWEQLDALWASFKKPSDSCDLGFENLLLGKYGASTWSPTHIKLDDFECKQKKEYKFYFPCVIATNSIKTNIHRRILGLDYFQYKMSLSSIFMEDIQKQWVNVPNIRYLEISFTNIIASDGGLLVVKGGEQPPQLNNDMNPMDISLLTSNNHYWTMNDYIKVKNQSMIIVTNPLTQEIKLLPPIPQKILHEKIARLSFYSSKRTAYRLILIGTCQYEEMIEENIETMKSTELALVVYCSIKNSWVHFDKVLNAAPPSKILGRPNLVIHEYSIYYGGIQIHPELEKKQISRPVIIYFNTHISRRQKLIIDFSEAGKSYSVNVVEPPKLVQIGFNAKIYAVTREAQFKEATDTLFIIEVVVNRDGTPTGSYKVLSEGVMPKSIYSLLFRKTNTSDDEITMYSNNLPPWEAMGSASDIAIKVIGFDPMIAIYNVQDGHWNYSYFPYNEPFEKSSNYEAWRLIPGVYEPRWNAMP